MNRSLVDRIADAVLYEGYILYPYRPSVKNHRRWTFGGLFPEAYRRPAVDSDRSSSRAECLVHGTPETALDARVRFLHLTVRQVGVLEPPYAVWSFLGAEPAYRPVASLRVGDRQYQTWQEAEEREVSSGTLPIADLLAGPKEKAFAFSGARRLERIRDDDGEAVGVLVREQSLIAGDVRLSAAEEAEGLFRVTIDITCRSPLEEGAGREEALLRALVSTHAILNVRDGEFASLLDPPDCWREAAGRCRNEGLWPVLVGEEGQRQTMLASPIILYDYPEIAPESPGDLFDGTEIDEILSLRIMTLTDAEKGAMAAIDERAAALLARTEGLGRDQWLGLHGTMRGVSARPGEDGHG